MNVLVTGANGFIGRHVVARLREVKDIKIIPLIRGDSDASLRDALSECDAVIHLAGENRPKDDSAFHTTNVGLTERITKHLRDLDKIVPVIFTSSAQVVLRNAYGDSKRQAESLLVQFAKINKNPTAIFRLPGVFGKWCKPNYNSVVATFCFNVAHGIPVHIEDKDIELNLVFIDDVIQCFLDLMNSRWVGLVYPSVSPQYNIKLGDLLNRIEGYSNSRNNLITDGVGLGFARALYSTYVSYLPPHEFSYQLKANEDSRGVFVEMLKTVDNGQFSFFTSLPGVTRGRHYHHTKAEKFIVVSGQARFRFRNIITDEVLDITTSYVKPTVVESVPGWAHEITNIGDEKLIVMLWANELFDPQNPDTFACQVEKSYQ